MNKDEGARILQQAMRSINKDQKYSVEKAVLHARVPVLKMRDSQGNLYDLIVTNQLGMENTKLLATYNKIDERLVLVARSLKCWAKSQNINDASQGTLSSYALIVMTIHFLQQLQPPVLPYLQDLGEEPRENFMGKFNCYFLPYESVASHFKRENEQCCGELLFKLLCYYTETFDFENNVICIRSPHVLTKKMKSWKGNLAIEDPFELDHNLTKGVKRYSFVRIIKCMREARKYFSQTEVFSLEDMKRTVVKTNNCSLCGRTDHEMDACQFNKDNIRCFACGQTGHMRMNCPNRR